MNYKESRFKGIIPFSGGIDSTFSMFLTLKENPNDNYCVFRVDLLNGNSGSRIIQEQRAVEAILDKLSGFGINNFKYRSLSFDYSSLGPPPVWDREIINFVSSIIIQDHPEICEFIEGTIADDYLQEGFNERLEKITRILYVSSARTSEDLKIVFPIKEMSKYQVMKELPSELLSLTWSCRYPEIGPPYTFVRCHKCPQCKVIDKVMADHPGEFDEFFNLAGS